MKKLITLFTAIAMVSACALPSHAAEKKSEGSATTSKTSQGKKKRDTFPYYGKIGKVDSKAMTFTVVGKSATRTFHVSSTTRVTRDGKPARLTDFKPGEQVSGSCKHAKEKGEGNYLVVSMRPRPAKKK